MKAVAPRATSAAYNPDMPPMQIVFAPVSAFEHELRVRRADGSEALSRGETRSLLRHDLCHLALEASYALEHGFWGLLASGCEFADLAHPDAQLGPDLRGPELMQIEGVVAMLQSLSKTIEATATAGERLWRAFQASAKAQGQRPPAWLDAEGLGRARETLRRLEGRWRATPVGGEMELAWPKLDAS